MRTTIQPDIKANRRRGMLVFPMATSQIARVTAASGCHLPSRIAERLAASTTPETDSSCGSDPKSASLSMATVSCSIRALSDLLKGSDRKKG